MQLLRLETEPLLELGLPGAFDSAGMGPSVALFVGDRVFLYYIGISLRRDVPHQWAIGLAISEDGGASFRRAAPGPILSTGPFDPFFASTTHVAYQGGVFRMYYMSGVAWECHGDRFDSRYVIKYARSTDGISWATEDRIALGFADLAETALARPWVVGRNDGYHMWFCRRGPRRGDPASEQPYRLGYARSADGLVWRGKTIGCGSKTRLDRASGMQRCKPIHAWFPTAPSFSHFTTATVSARPGSALRAS